MSYRDAQPPGFEITTELKTWESQHMCPRCGYGLYAGEKDAFRIEACGWCGGVWMNEEQAKRALVTGSHAPEELASKVEKSTRQVLVQDSDATALPCPECKKGMDRSKIGSTTIDQCIGHGTWFDRMELAAVMRNMRGEAQPKSALEEKYYAEVKSPFHAELKEVKETLAFLFRALTTKDPFDRER
jgi:Zn-finger nucleic acid-binding protein